jgi:DNA helicase IV
VKKLAPIERHGAPPEIISCSDELDEIIIPNVNKKTYKSEHDRKLLYIACTRAMHKLTLTYTEEISPFCS